MQHRLSSEGVLSAFLRGGLDAQARREIVEHVSHCAECYERWKTAADASSKPRGSTWTRYGRIAAIPAILAVGAAALLHNAARPAASLNSMVRGTPSPELANMAAKLRTVAEEQPSPENLHALGLSLVPFGKLDQAIDVLRRAADGDPSNRTYKSDLAAAYLARATRDRTGEDYAAACDELTKLVLTGTSAEPEVAFNLALALEGLENRIAAERAWTEYLAIDSSSPRAEEARRHLAGLREMSKPLPEVTDTMATDAEWVCSEPLRTRRYAEKQLLPRWAEATLRGDAGAAGVAFSVLTRAAEALDRCTGDRCLLSVTASLSSASPSDARKAASAILALRVGFERAAKEQGRGAAAAYEHAADALKDAGLSLHLLAAGHAAFQYYYAGDAAAARRLLDETPGDEANAPGWTGQLHWVDGLVQVVHASPYGSLEQYQKALDLFMRIHDRRNAAALEMLVAENLTVLNASRDAWPHRLNALAALRRDRDPQREQVALNEAAEAALSSARPFTARAYQQSAQTLVAEDDDPEVVAYGELWLALINARCGLHGEALVALQRARELAARIPGQDVRRRTEAEIDFAAGTISEVTNASQSIVFWSSALDYYRSVDAHYRAAQLLLSRGRLYRRLGQRERARADLTAGVGELEARRTTVQSEPLRTSFFGRGAELFDELISLDLEDGAVAAAYEAAERRRERTLLDAFEQTVSGIPATTAIVRETLQSDEILLDYTVLHGGLVRWEVRRSGVTASRVNVTAGELRRLIDAVYASDDSGKISKSQQRALASLGQWLIPADILRRQEGRLVIVPDPLLNDVPFAALTDGKSFLIEKHSLALAPSASLFVGCRQRERATAFKQGRGDPPRAFVFGDTRGVATMNLPALTGAARELRDAATALKTTPVLDRDATKRTFLRNAPQYDIVYVAGHAAAGTISSRPALVMAFERSEGGDPLTIEEIRQSRLRGRLVVLAACGTGVQQGEGVTSLARAFLVAGVPAVTASLLSVDDRATQRLLAPFSREVIAGRAPTEALRSVQLAALERDRSADPLSWAGFQIYGSASLPISRAY